MSETPKQPHKWVAAQIRELADRIDAGDFKEVEFVDLPHTCQMTKDDGPVQHVPNGWRTVTVRAFDFEAARKAAEGLVAVENE